MKEWSSHLQFYLKGSRTYVHGTTQFDSFCRELRSQGNSQFVVHHLQFHREIYHNARMVMTSLEDTTGVSSEHDPATIMTFSVNGQRYAIYLIEDTASPVRERCEDTTAEHICDLQLTGDYSSKANLNQIDSIETLVAVLVETNKKTHTLTTPQHKNYRWVYLKNLPVKFGSDIPSDINVDVEHLGLKKRDSHSFYSLNQIKYSIDDENFQPLICFAFH